MNVKFYTDADGFYLGSFWDGTLPPEGAVKCDEGPDGHRLVAGEWQRVPKDEWEAHFAPPQTVEEWRATATADAWQLVAVLGAERWQAIVEWAQIDFVTATLVAKATVIPRASETVDVLAYVLGMTDTEVDDVFRAAAALRA